MNEYKWISKYTMNKHNERMYFFIYACIYICLHPPTHIQFKRQNTSITREAIFVPIISLFHFPIC